MSNLSRRSLFVHAFMLAFANGLFPRALADTLAASWPMGVPDAGGSPGSGNFRAIYANPVLREKFFLFLKNVFHLYPEDKFHKLIQEVANVHRDDAEVYGAILKRLDEIKPSLSEISYALPALQKQKQEIATQTARILGDRRAINGYIEIGTPGRYVQAIGEKLEIKGDVYLVHDRQPDFGINDIIERGQISPAGQYVPLANYDQWRSDQLKDASVDLVTNFIGLHHSPPEKLDGFVQSIRRVLRPGGIFILRDHDADTPEMGAMVGLAHDVFNAGLKASWETNRAEIRHFKSLSQIEKYLASQGFNRIGETLYQEGDPTKNALMRFVKKS